MFVNHNVPSRFRRCWSVVCFSIATTSRLHDLSTGNGWWSYAHHLLWTCIHCKHELSFVNSSYSRFNRKQSNLLSSHEVFGFFCRSFVLEVVRYCFEFLLILRDSMGWYFFESILIISMKLLFLQLTYTSIRMKMHRCIHNTIHFDEFRRMEKRNKRNPNCRHLYSS